MYKKTVLSLAALLLLAIVGFWFWQSGGEPDTTGNNPVNRSAEQSQTAEQEQTAVNAQYTTYSEAELANEYDRHVLFFYASWCPDCQAFKRNLTMDGAIPENVQVLEVDYDTATELKQRYGITIQSSFVEVDAQGNQIAKWVGYYKSEGNSFADINAGLSGG